MSHRTHSSDSRLVIGILFLVLGIYFLLNNFDLIPFSLPYYLVSWQTLLIAIGLLIIGTSDKKGGGIFLIAVGAIFLLSDVVDISIGDIIRQFWPLVLVTIGVSLLLRSRIQKNNRWIDDEHSSLQRIDESSVFGVNEKVVTTGAFQGGRVTSIFGSNRINFANSQLEPGRQEIDVFVLFGAVEFIVPEDWNVKVEVSPIIGGFEDHRQYHRTYSPDAGRQLLIRGPLIVGGGKIRLE